jgi:hypothetical protein
LTKRAEQRPQLRQEVQQQPFTEMNVIASMTIKA